MTRWSIPFSQWVVSRSMMRTTLNSPARNTTREKLWYPRSSMEVISANWRITLISRPSTTSRFGHQLWESSWCLNQSTMPPPRGILLSSLKNSLLPSFSSSRFLNLMEATWYLSSDSTLGRWCLCYQTISKNSSAVSTLSSTETNSTRELTRTRSSTTEMF